MTTRTELIDDCSTYVKVGVSQEARRLLRQCKDMLEADTKLQAAARLALDALEISKPEHPNCTVSRRTYNKAVTALREVIE
jgi:hypothetical protein